MMKTLGFIVHNIMIIQYFNAGCKSRAKAWPFCTAITPQCDGNSNSECSQRSSGAVGNNSDVDDSDNASSDTGSEYVPEKEDEEIVSDSLSEGSVEVPQVGSVDIPLRVEKLEYLNNVHISDVPDTTNSKDDSDTTDEDEDEIIRDEDNNRIYVRRVVASKSTKAGKAKKCDRVYNARHCCPFGCNELYTNFSQHLLGKMHENEPEVMEISQIIVSSKDSADTKEQKMRARKKVIAILRNRGINQTKGNLIIQSAIIAGRLTGEASSNIVKEVFPIMRNDAIGKLAMTDPLIVTLGNEWLLRNLGNRLMRKYYVSAAMRLSSRLLVALRGMVTPNTGNDMEDYVDPAYFSHIVRATLKVAGQDAHDEENLKAPSNALKLSFDIKRLANIKLGKAIESHSKDKKEAAQDFLQLMSIQWTTKLERVVLEERRRVENKPVPLPSDVVAFSKYLTNEAVSCNFEDMSYANFRKVVIVALAALISYNRRRPGDVQAIK
ncbi:hypothetical protein BSL78_19344 [Apostichopus japonicus]|uniref:Uncharacterized protein n=1 Tax=Stichopus japonicus TaxID=307972 RepID=A0A2G8K6Z5_STIJA|nr:hypothetical protein BSL78_19344 [Apostichopus japonicus]